MCNAPFPGDHPAGHCWLMGVEGNKDRCGRPERSLSPKGVLIPINQLLGRPVGRTEGSLRVADGIGVGGAGVTVMAALGMRSFCPTRILLVLLILFNFTNAWMVTP